VLIALVLLGLSIAGLRAAEVAETWRAEIIALAEAHQRREVAHKGWSFPARIYSEAVPLNAPGWRLLAEARTRDYEAACPAAAPGQYCEESGRVIPRRGAALEPVLLGWLIGPDAEIREHLPYAEAPPHLIEAIVAAEDQEFYAHSGVHLAALVRASLANAREGKYAQGASTLSMQAVRVLTQRREKTIDRKLRELVMAYALDRQLGKQGVLQLYLDAPYLGQRGGLSICGFESAAQHFFAKPARDLDLAEAATLAAMLPAPGRNDPRLHPERARERRDHVLRAMRELFGRDVDAALAQPVATAAPRPLAERTPAYLSAVRSWLTAQLTEDQLFGAGLVITAAVDLPLQATTELLLAERSAHLQTLLRRRQEQPLQAAAALVDVVDGRLRAVYGGHGVGATDFNRATQAWRQPGSAFKPVLYALAFNQPPGDDGSPRFTAASTQPNQRRRFKHADPRWFPRNVQSEYTPTASLAYALAGSQNVATVSLLEELGGPAPLIAFSQQLGFDTSRFAPEMGLALGQAEVTPLQMAQAIATIAGDGRLITGTPVLRVVDGAGRERIGPPRPGEQVLSAAAAALTRELMELVIRYGTGGTVRGIGGLAGYKGEAIGKTGTTDDEKDSWFVGATPRFASALWLGFDEPERIGGTASDLAAPLWGWWMHALTEHEDELPRFAEEPELIHRNICTVTGKVAGEHCRGLPAPFLPGSQPRELCAELHPEPAPSPEDEAQPAYESLWKRREREQAEAERAAKERAEASGAAGASDAATVSLAAPAR